MSENESEPVVNPAFNTLIADLREDYITTESTQLPLEKEDLPKEGKEVKMGRKLPKWAYVGIFGTACLVVLFSVFFVTSSRNKEVIAQQNNELDGVTAVISDDPILASSFPTPVDPTEVPDPATPTAIPLPEQSEPVAPESTAWPDPPEPTPLPEPPTE